MKMSLSMSRTLPLSLSGALIGVALAAADYRVDWKTAVLLVLSVIFMHFYSICSKSESEKTWSRVFLALTIVCGLGMLHFSFGTLFLMEPLILIVFGYMIIRAVKYTTFVSRGKGILYVFLLFGLLAVYGSYYVCSHSFGSWPLLFPPRSLMASSVCSRTSFPEITPVPVGV